MYEEVWLSNFTKHLKQKRREQYDCVQKAAVQYVQRRIHKKQEHAIKQFGHSKIQQTVVQVPDLSTLACVKVCEENLYSVFEDLNKEYVFKRLVRNEAVRVEVAHPCICWDYNRVVVNCNCWKRSWEKLNSYFLRIYASEILDWDDEYKQRLIAMYPIKETTIVDIPQVNYNAEIEFIIEEMLQWVRQGNLLEQFQSTDN